MPATLELLPFTLLWSVESVFYDRESSDTHSDRIRHSLAGTSDIQIDSSSSVKVNVNGYTGTSQNSSDYQSQALSEENELVNSSNRMTYGTGDNSSLNANALWRKRFRKKGRTLSVNLEERYNITHSIGIIAIYFTLVC